MKGGIIKLEQIDIMIIVPHEDDELIIAGEVIVASVLKRKRIKVVFVTNGDYYRHQGELRLQEAIDSLKVLGIESRDIVFLGYGDQCQMKHIYNGSKSEIIKSHNGNIHTYGLQDHQDYSFMKFQTHHLYTRENYKSDIYEQINIYRPGTIITTGWDNHPDHISVSLMVDECVNEIRNQCQYVPLLLKAQAYTGKWEGLEDYYSFATTQKVNYAYGTDDENPLQKWDDRLAFSAPKGCQTRFIRNNILYKAGKCYKSQGAKFKALQFSNSDIVFWRRLTDNSIINSTISSSSGDVRYLANLKCLDCSDLTDEQLKYMPNYWVTDEKDFEKHLEVRFFKKTKIREMHFYENPDEKCIIKNIRMTFDGKNEVYSEELNHDGSCKTVLLKEPIECDKMDIYIESWDGNNIGLAQLEIHSEYKTLEDYDFPLELYEEHQIKCGFIVKKMQALEYLTLKIEEWLVGRMVPNVYLLMQYYPDLNVNSKKGRIWKAHIMFWYGRLIERMK